MFDLFDEVFDFDNSGELDFMEESAKFSFIMGMMEEEEKSRIKEDNTSFFKP